MFPICLLGNEYTQGIGFGYKTLIPCYSKKDLKKRLMWLLKIRKTEPIIKPKTDCTITADKSELKKLLTEGEGKLDVEGVIEEFPHQNKVSLKSWPPGRRFEYLLKKFSDELSANMIGYTDSSVQTTDIVFQVIRQRNRDAIYKDFVEKLKPFLVGVLSFDIIMVDENHVVGRSSVDSLLLHSYNNYKKAVVMMLKTEIENIKSMMHDYKLLLKIRPAIKKHMSGKLDIQGKIHLISDQSNVPVADVERLLKLNIKRLLTMELDLVPLNEKLKQTKDNLNHIETYVLKQYESI
jgi:hypothetical protein